MNSKKVSMALVGAGARGFKTYAAYALLHPEDIEFVAIAEPNEVIRKEFVKVHNIDESMAFKSYEELLSQPRLADGFFICTQDKLHYEPTMMAIEKGYTIFLEKPISPNLKECIEIREKAEKFGVDILVCHVLRYTDFFTKIKAIIDDKVIGDIISIQQNENVAYFHFAHSYVRGEWRNSEESSSFMMAKCCHDLDILQWLIGSECVKIASFGSLIHYTKANAPKSAPIYCLDGCEKSNDCAFYAPRIYMGPARGWLENVGQCMDNEQLIEYLKSSNYGRCVYNCDNNVCDHQVTSMEFNNGVTANFHVAGFSHNINRTIRIMGTLGEIVGSLEDNIINVYSFNSENHTTYNIVNGLFGGHSGGDNGLMRAFVSFLKTKQYNNSLTTIGNSLQSHIMACAAEKSRKEIKVIDLSQYVQDVKSGKEMF